MRRSSGTADVLDASASVPWRALAAVVAVVLAVAAGGAVGLRHDRSGPPDGVRVALVDHSGSALDGQSFVRFWFALEAEGGSADVEHVELVLGGEHADGQPPGRIGAGDRAQVLVDVVPRCPQAVDQLASGTLDVTFRSGTAERHERLPLPFEGSLPRLIVARCGGGDAV